MGRPRVGYYLATSLMGGTEKHVLALIDGLGTKNCDFTVFSHFSPARLSSFPDELKRRGVHLCLVGGESPKNSQGVTKDRRRPAGRDLFQWAWRHLPGAGFKATLRHTAAELSAIPRVRAELAAARLDVIHFHAGALEVLYRPLIASRLAGIPTRLLTVHNSVGRDHDSSRIIEWLALRSVQRIITASEYVKGILVSNKRVAAKRVEVIPHGIDATKSGRGSDRMAARAALNLPDGIPVVGVVARLDQRKGHDLLIRAAPLVRDRVGAVKLVMVGEGPEEEALRQLARQLGVSDMVIFAGHRTDAQRLMNAFDIVAVPSRDEGFSLVILEAMTCEVPVVATRVGGIPSVALDGVTGLLVPSEDVSALARALIRLLENSKEAQEMGRAGRERARRHFPLETMLERTFSRYNLPRSESRLGHPE